LVQAGICTGALVEETSFWVEYFQEQVIDKLDNNIRIDKVESYANKQILRSAAIAAFGAALLILLDVTFYRCCRQQDNNAAMDDVMTTTKTQTDLNLQEMEEAAAKGRSESSTIGDSPTKCDSPTAP
jgi:hypothetical protein